MTDDAQTVRKNVEHLARGCRSDMHHDPTRYAQEIRVALDRLEAERDRLEKERNGLQHVIDCADTPLMRDVLAERDRLREALEKIADTTPGGKTVRLPYEIAREALGGHQ